MEGKEPNLKIMLREALVKGRRTRIPQTPKRKRNVYVKEPIPSVLLRRKAEERHIPSASMGSATKPPDRM
jgi:hypothetical protein